ncbi:MAG: DNA cytosine methyltransferase [Gammaproteobacteria bacterium]
MDMDSDGKETQESIESSDRGLPGPSRQTTPVRPKPAVNEQAREKSKQSISVRGVAVELCCGMGGMGIGLRELGFDVRAAYDVWSDAVAVYNHNFGEDAAQTCNLLQEAGRQLVRARKAHLGDIELLAAGPPCKGFSQLRNGFHDGRNGHNRVLRAMPEYVALLRPRMFLIENVPALLSHRQGKTLEALLAKLQRPAPRLSYRVEYGVYDAAACGTPQARKRVLILGVREGSGNESLPEPDPDLAPLFAAIRHSTPIPDQMRQYHRQLLSPRALTLTTAKQALSDLPSLGAGNLEEQLRYATRPQSAYQRWARQGAPQLLSDTRTPAVTAETLKRLILVPPGGCARSIPETHLNGLLRRYDSAYRRLHPDAPSTALSTKYDCVYHFEQHRSLSVREYARLQGIPDRVTFPQELTCRRSAYEMIGNSVPPLLVKHVLARALGIVES